MCTILNYQIQGQRTKQQVSSFNERTQAQINAGWEGWLAPAQDP
jgi:hypothetical protein